MLNSLFRKQIKHKCGVSSGLTPNESFDLEVSALSKLKGYDHFPQIVGADKKSLSIFTSFCGVGLSFYHKRNSVTNIDNLDLQIFNIVNTLQKENIIHLDVYLSNICLHQGKIYLIDFGMCIINDVVLSEKIKNRYEEQYSPDPWKNIEDKLYSCINSVT